MHTFAQQLKVQVGACGHAGISGQADELFLCDALAFGDMPLGEVAIAGFEANGMADADRVSACAAIAAVRDDAVGDGPDGGTYFRGIVHAFVGALKFEDGVHAHAEARGNVDEFEGGLEEGFTCGGAVLHEIGFATVGEAIAVAAFKSHEGAFILGGEDVAIGERTAFRNHFFDDGANAVALLDVSIEVNVPGEDVGEDDGNFRTLAGGDGGIPDGAVDGQLDDFDDLLSVHLTHFPQIAAFFASNLPLYEGVSAIVEQLQFFVFEDEADLVPGPCLAKVKTCCGQCALHFINQCVVQPCLIEQVQNGLFGLQAPVDDFCYVTG